MKFDDLKCANGTSIKTYAEVLQEKAAEAGLTVVLVFAGKGDKYKGIHTISNIKSSVPEALIALGTTMLEKSN